MFDSNLITTQKNLLAFSGGVDSSALFFILLKKNIPFDIIIIDYNQRKQSKKEVQYAQNLASKYNKKCFLKEYNLSKFSEKDARDFRYDFFDEIIKKYNYEALITAHQLNDKFEWFLMQLSKGAGLKELIGLQPISKRGDYTVYRPLLEISKDELLQYLEKNNIKYFIDSSNTDIKYKRNLFRTKFSNEFIATYKEGVKKSFAYLQKDIESLEVKPIIEQKQELKIATFDTTDTNILIRFIDAELKQRGIIISSKTREEIIDKKEVVVSHKIVVSIVENKVFIAPYIANTKLNKAFKEQCRKTNIPPLIRPYLAKTMGNN